MTPYLLSPVVFLLSGLSIGNGYFPIACKAIHSVVNNQFSHYPIHLSISNTVLNASVRRKRNEFSGFIYDASSPSTSSSLDANNESKKISSAKKIKSFSSKTENQASYVELMRDDEVDIVIVAGPAGTGKTMLACYAAVEALKLGKVSKIVITRPVVSVDEDIGFLPGGLTSKMDPWTRPVFDALRETYSSKEIDNMIEDGVIEIVPLGFMRGRTFKRAWIIADEMQNSTPMQMLMLATRIGEDSKMVITGDLNQSDRTGLNGLREIREKVFARKDNIASCVRIIELQADDIQRSRAAKAILDIYDTPPANLSPNKPAKIILTKQTPESDAALIPLHHISKHSPHKL